MYISSSFLSVCLGFWAQLMSFWRLLEWILKSCLFSINKLKIIWNPLKRFSKYYIPHGRQCGSSNSVRCHFLFFQCSWNFRRKPDWLLVIKQIDWRKLYNYNLTRNLWKLLAIRISVIYSLKKSCFFNSKLISVIWRVFFSLKENHRHTSNLVKFTWFKFVNINFICILLTV